MTSLQQVRGSGIRLTLPYVLRFSGMWLLVSVLILLVFSVTCYTALFLRAPSESRDTLILVLTVQTVFVLLALVALAIFSTHRLAGPIVAMRRACDEVKAGNLDRPLRFRRSDPHLFELESPSTRWWPPSAPGWTPPRRPAPSALSSGPRRCGKGGAALRKGGTIRTIDEPLWPLPRPAACAWQAGRGSGRPGEEGSLAGGSLAPSAPSRAGEAAGGCSSALASAEERGAAPGSFPATAGSFCRRAGPSAGGESGDEEEGKAEGDVPGRFLQGGGREGSRESSRESSTAQLRRCSQSRGRRACSRGGSASLDAHGFRWNLFSRGVEQCPDRRARRSGCAPRPFPGVGPYGWWRD